MPTLLQVDSSPLPTSVSRELTREFAAAWIQSHPDGQIIYRDVAAQAPQPIDAAWIAASYTPEEARTPEQIATLAVSEELIAELEQAEEYVIGVAMHNFSIPSSLKLWLDQVVRKDKTFAYDQRGPRGLLAGKKATLAIASGNVYHSGSPYAAYNFTDPYLKTLLGFLGITDLTVVSAGGTAQLMHGADRETFLKPTLDQIRALAA
jgi:FMN-dependent NADH-azoreductase